MTSKYLGTLGKWDFHIATTLGEYGDLEAVRTIQRERYKHIIEGRNGNPGNIFCTAITLDHENQREISQFDDLETTYHIFSIGNEKADGMKGKIGCVCSYATESQEKEGGVVIGLPHENKVRNNGYPAGFDLDSFREKYEYKGRKTEPEERVELFRHLKPSRCTGDDAARLGVYKGGYQEFIKERERKGKKPVTKWLFCSNTKYYNNVYRPLGSMIIPILLSGQGINFGDASPPLKEISINKDDHTKSSGGCTYKGIQVSYRYPVIMSRDPRGKEETKWYNYLSQLVDWEMWTDIENQDRFLIHNIPLIHSKEGFMPAVMRHVALRVIGGDVFMKNYGKPADEIFNYLARQAAKSNPMKGWE